VTDEASAPRVLDGIEAVPDFDPGIDLAPCTLFRRLQEGPPLLLLTVDAPRPTLEGARPWRPGEPLPAAPPEGEIVLIDQDGTAARALAVELHASGHGPVKALFGGVTLYDYSLDPQVVGEERFLRPLDEVGD
jgi:hypothetical protein